ncbi:hypothetical protein SK128_016647 [Halocaridina rubra]|uniref:Uncharacterized protein n=1 Tax=Halocaridina rubra TaxID=373956 RepID=A0AAN8ZZT8_HALRR
MSKRTENNRYPKGTKQHLVTILKKKTTLGISLTGTEQHLVITMKKKTKLGRHLKGREELLVIISKEQKNTITYQRN